jgi:NADPH:quinone reductase-like Zn-dependent oxidoreductase
LPVRTWPVDPLYTLRQNAPQSSGNTLEERFMKAIVRTRYGPPDVLQFTEVEKPTPKDNEVLIELYAASLNPLDLFSMRGVPLIRLIPALRAPKHKVLGADIAGRVEAIGRQVKQFQPGDEVFGVSFTGGGFAEYVCTVENRLALKPASISFEDAAAVPVAAITALQGLRDKGRIRRGQKVLVDGASGGVGTFAVQIAKSFGAEVTAVCSTRNVDTARSLGADHIIDYTREDFTQSGQRYDLILGANGHHSIFDYRRALSRDGIYVAVGGGLFQIFQAASLAQLLSLISSKKTCFFIANMNRKDLVFLKDLLETGKLVPVIDRRYPLSDAAEALRYLEEGHARGKVVLTVEHSNGACRSQ